MRCELLIHAKAQEIFSLYQDPYHWSNIFHGIHRAYFDQSIVAGAKGAVDIAGAGRWRMKIDSVYDDHQLTIHLRRLFVRLSFRLQIDRIEDELCRVSHHITPGFFFLPALLFFRRSILEWLNINLFVVRSQIEHTRIAQQAKTRRKKTASGGKRSRRAPKKRQTRSR